MKISLLTILLILITGAAYAGEVPNDQDDRCKPQWYFPSDVEYDWVLMTIVTPKHPNHYHNSHRYDRRLQQREIWVQVPRREWYPPVDIYPGDCFPIDK